MAVERDPWVRSCLMALRSGATKDQDEDKTFVKGTKDAGGSTDPGSSTEQSNFTVLQLKTTNSWRSKKMR